MEAAFESCREDEELREKVDDALAELQKDGTISALSKKFFSGIDASYQNH